MAHSLRPSRWRRLTTGLLATMLVAAGLIVASPTPRASAVQYPQTSLVSKNPVAWTPWVDDGWVQSIAQVGSKIIAGGKFTSVRAPNAATGIPRTNLFAFDATTGAIDPNFHPTFDGEVNAVVPSPDGQSVIVGGLFSTVNGQARSNLVALSVSNGAIVSSFTGTARGGAIFEMVVRGNMLYLGGKFNTVNGVPRSYLAAVDAWTGALDNRLNFAFAGTVWGSGSTLVDALDVTPDGSRMVVIGNFSTIDGQSRVQVAQIDLTTTPFSLANWSTERFSRRCSTVFAYYLWDVDYSPDGSYFALVTTGGPQGLIDAGVMCDTASRWETYATGSTLQPTWIDYTGGDTLVGVAVTAAAVYVTGHQRWMNNPYMGDAVGPGALQRQGLAALDPLNGVPFSWNPYRSTPNGSIRGTLLATQQGLWLGHDNTFVSGYRPRLAFFPLAGGTAIPSANPGTLPGALYSLPSKTCPANDPSILYRVNAGGGALGSLDCGPGWAVDTNTDPSPYRNSGSSVANYRAIRDVHASVPATTPSAIFESERWDGSSSPEMLWTFPVPAGTRVAVRLYFGNQHTSTDSSGERVFDVLVNGQVVLDNYDIIKDVGHQVGTMKSFNVTSSGSVTVSFGHVVQNPLINGIELVNLDVTPVQPVPQMNLEARTFDGSSAGSPTTLATSVDWSQARGAFMLDETLYTGWRDGKLYAREFDGSSLGPASLLDPYLWTPGPFWTYVTGAFFANGSLYYTLQGDPTMHSRYFTPESGVVGAVQFNVPSNGFNWSQASGLTMADDRLYWATPDGNLHSAVFASGAPQSGTDTIVSGPAVGDGQTWGGNGMFVLSTSAPADTQDPSAPTNLQATSVTATQVELEWDASTDNVGVSSYEVFRNGSLRAVVPGSQTAFSDTTVTSGTFYSYQVFAKDAAGNTSTGSNQVDVTTPIPTVAFSDGFESGNLSNWTTSTAGMSVQASDVFAGSFAAQATSTGTRAFARRDLSTTYTSLSYRTAFKIVSQGPNAVNLLRLQNATGGNILLLFVSSNGNLMLRNDVAGANVWSPTIVPPGAWHQAEVVVTVNGSSSTVQVLLDGSQVNALTTTLNLGTNPIGRLILGDENNNRTFQVRFDEVVATP